MWIVIALIVTSAVVAPARASNRDDGTTPTATTPAAKPAEASMSSVISSVFRPAAASATGIACLMVGAALLIAPRLRRLARLAPEST